MSIIAAATLDWAADSGGPSDWAAEPAAGWGDAAPAQAPSGWD